MTQYPLVSVIIPTLNRKELIKKAIDSILNQTYKNIEIIIVDGSNSDETEKMIYPYLNNLRIQYIHQKENHTKSLRDRRNIAKARNKAVKMAKGKYIAFLDDDDFWCNKKKLEKQIQFLENQPEYVICGAGIIVRDERNPKNPIFFKRLFPEKDESIRKTILFGPPFLHSCVIFSRDAFQKTGGFDEEHDIGDWEIFLKLGKVGKMYSFPDYFVEYRMLPKEKIAREILKSRIRVIKRYQNDYPYFIQASLSICVRFLYSFLPFSFRWRLSPLISQIKKFLGHHSVKIKF